MNNFLQRITSSQTWNGLLSGTFVGLNHRSQCATINVSHYVSLQTE